MVRVVVDQANPITMWMLAVKAHDRCLEKHSQCYCDRKFLECLRRKTDLTTKKGRVATLMYIYMKVQTVFTCKD